jgi:hypothetical protein
MPETSCGLVPATLTPEEVLATRPTGAGLPKRRFAGEWLRQYLQDGCETQGTIERDAERDGVCIATLRRAKFDLGVRSARKMEPTVLLVLGPPSPGRTAAGRQRGKMIKLITLIILIILTKQRT